VLRLLLLIDKGIYLHIYLTYLTMSSARPRTSASSSGQQQQQRTSIIPTRRSKSPDLLQQEQPGLRRIVQQRLLKDVFESTSGT
jgi:hypothetical protein